MPEPIDRRDYVDGGRHDKAKIKLGRLLFFDKILSGNKNIACATCHHPRTGTGDALFVSTGEGGKGLGVDRSAEAILERIPRNAPALFALGHEDAERIFWDGRVAHGPDGSFVSPAGSDLPDGLENLLAVQAMFPVQSAAEMAGHAGSNPVADAAAAGDLPLVWELLAQRLRDSRYAGLFARVYRLRNRDDITYVHAANAIAAYEIAAFRHDDTPFDRYLGGNRQALTAQQRRGMRLFYGSAGCSSCHSGPLLSDFEFHAIAMPQVGPGKGDGQGGAEDFGLGRETGLTRDRYKFRTPPLRGVALTGPYGHGGAYATLEGVVRHHLDPVASLNGYACGPELARSTRPDLDEQDCKAHERAGLRRKIARANELEPTTLRDSQVADLVAFMEALTDPRDLGAEGRLLPRRVPSGLPVVD